MAVYHDAHLFDIARFSSRIARYLRDRGRAADAYRRLRAEALRAFEENPEVRRLASDYGGWDLEAIGLQVPAGAPEDIEDEAFWMVLLLYDSFRPGERALGLGENWRLPGGATPRGIDESDWQLLVRGRDFAELPIKEDIDPDVLRSIRPGATASRAGWLDLPDIRRLLQSVESVTERLDGNDDSHDRPALSSAAAMLEAARNEAWALCLVTSG